MWCGASDAMRNEDNVDVQCVPRESLQSRSKKWGRGKSMRKASDDDFGSVLGAASSRLKNRSTGRGNLGRQ